MDREDARDLINACVGESRIDVRATRFPKAEVLADIFSLTVNMRKEIPQLLDEHYGYFDALAPLIIELQKSYSTRKRATNAMDFDDLLEFSCGSGC